MNSKTKTRNQSIHTFLESLQEEYVIAQLRSKIYPKRKDKFYYRERVMVGKREKIEAIAERNSLDTIFTNEEVKEEFEMKMVPKWGIPNFSYRNDETRDWQYGQDRLNYFSRGSDVVILLEDGETTTGQIVSNDYLLASGMLEVKVKGKSKPRPIPTTNLRRIL